MQGTVVGVLRGGPTNEHEVSLKSGATVLKHLPEPRYTTRDIFIDKEGVWHYRGKPIAPERILPTLDVAIITTHGEYGENGRLQQLLESYGVPYVGADPFASFLAMHKVMAKEKVREAGLLVPEYRYVEAAADAPEIVAEIVRAFHQPVVVKPVAWGSSVGVSVEGGYAPVLAAVEKLFGAGASGVLIEELIRGTEATVGVVENLRSEKLYALPAVEIIPPGDDFFSYDSKYNGASKEIVPGRFHRKVNEELARSAKLAHEALGQRHYSRSDFIVAPKGVYFLELNSAAAVGMTDESLFPKSLEAIGMKMPDFLTHLVNLALSR